MQISCYKGSVHPTTVIEHPDWLLMSRKGQIDLPSKEEKVREKHSKIESGKYGAQQRPAENDDCDVRRKS